MNGDVSCPIAPLNDRVIVIGDEPAKQVGLIHLPDQAKEAPQRGTVVAVGPGKIAEPNEVVGSGPWVGSMRRIPPTVRVGQKVWYGKYVGSVITIDKVEYRILYESEIYGVDQS